MPETFGARLRRRREEQNVALSTIAEQTKIKLSLLDALERDDVSHWPSGIFRRAYIRAYAHAIGLCPDATLKEFLQVYPDPDHVVATAAAMLAAAERDGTSGAPPSRLRYMVSSALGSLARMRRELAESDVRNAPLHVMAEPTNEPGEPLVERATDEVRLLNHPPELSAAEPVEQVADGIAAADVAVTTGTSEHDAALDPPVPQDHVENVINSSTPAQAGGTDALESTAAPAELPFDETPSEPAVDLRALADLCTSLGRVDTADALCPLLCEAARILDATGVIVWIWDPARQELRGALAHGYSDRVLAQLPSVTRDAENATAAAFRLAESCVIEASGATPGALVVPLQAPYGCCGVLAMELLHGGERSPSVHAAASIVAALIAQLVGGTEAGQAAEEDDIVVSLVGDTRPIRVNVRSEDYVARNFGIASSGKRR